MREYTIAKLKEPLVGELNPSNCPMQYKYPAMHTIQLAWKKTSYNYCKSATL
jgi:hypothetical protein